MRNYVFCIQCVYKYFEGDYSAVFEWNKGEIKS